MYSQMYASYGYFSCCGGWTPLYPINYVVSQEWFAIGPYGNVNLCNNPPYPPVAMHRNFGDTSITGGTNYICN